MSMSVPALFGVETEFAVAALDGNERALPLEGVVRRIRERAAARPHLPGDEAGIFLQNGGRFYIDVGHHPEYASPETTNPWDAVRYSFAGDRLLAQLAREVAGADPAIAHLVVRKGNVDYTTGATWASHENYLHRRSPTQVRPALVAHLVSRIVFTGGGGFDPFDRSCLRFVLSPRALFVRRAVASSEPGGFALVDEREQSHCTGYYRQHLMCGDANLSQLAMFLRIGTTALVVALIDAGCAGDDAVMLDAPLDALAMVARDVTLRRTLALVCGRRVTAVEIQRHYLGQVRAHLARLPDWASAVCDLWQDTLDRLDHGPAAVADRLDWAIKQAVYRDHARRHGRAWPVPDSLEAPRGVGQASEADDGWRAEMCEIDLHFGQVSPSSLFDALDRAGVLDHRVAGIDEIDQAVSAPPADGRASVRGRVVTRLAAQGGGVSCGWDRVRDVAALKTLDLSNPFVDSEQWRDLASDERVADVLLERLAHLIRIPVSAATRDGIRVVAERFGAFDAQTLPRRSGGHALTLNNHAFDLRNAGRLQEAEWLMRAALATDLAVRPADHPKVPHRRNNLGTVLLMQGRVAEAREQITRAWQQTGERYDLTSARILTVRLIIALMDHEPGGPFLGQLKSHLAIQPMRNVADVDLYWKMAPVLTVLTPHLRPVHLRLLKAVVGVLNREWPIETLDAMPRWRNTVALPLDTAWPAAFPP